MNKLNILSNSQFGFKTNYSVSMVLMELMKEITGAADQKRSCVSVYVDLRKEFDSIDQNILIEGLKKYGIRGLTVVI